MLKCNSAHFHVDAGQIVVRLAERTVIDPRIDVVALRRAQIALRFRDLAKSKMRAGSRVFPIVPSTDFDRMFEMKACLSQVTA